VTPKITVESAEQMTVEFEPGTTNVIVGGEVLGAGRHGLRDAVLPDAIWQYAGPGVGGG
jgi:hypothetical protein